MIILSPEEAGRALATGPLVSEVTGVSTDTRTVRPGDLFVALRGERFDGHDYVQAALDAGACGAVVERRVWQERGQAGRADIYPVDDTLEALGALSRAVRRKSGALVFAVTGSVGKTSTKEILGRMVGRVCRVVMTAANQNNEIGVPLTLLQIAPDTEAVVVEMGMRGRGQIAALARIAEPDVGVITNIHPVHLEVLGSLDSIAEAKAELVHGLREGGVAVVPFGCGPLEQALESHDPAGEGETRRIVRFGVGAQECEDGQPDFVGSVQRAPGSGGGFLSLRWPGGEAGLEIPAMPDHSVQNGVAASAACYAAGLPLHVCLPGLLDAGPDKGRGEVQEFPGLCLIDDTYNANPAAVRAAIDNLVRMAVHRGLRPVAVLGDMRELGPEEVRYHREAGEYAAAAGVRQLWGVGLLSLATTEGFDAAGRPGVAAGHVASPAEASCVCASLRPGDIVLFKASRTVRLEVMLDEVARQARAGRWAQADETGAGVAGRRSGPTA